MGRESDKVQMHCVGDPRIVFSSEESGAPRQFSAVGIPKNGAARHSIQDDA